MAKALKKRALAEYSQTVTIEGESVPSSTSTPVPVKRLRLRKGPEGGSEPSIPSALEEEINSLDPSRSSADNFRTLSRIVTYFPSNNVRRARPSLDCIMNALFVHLVKDAAEALLLSKLKTLFAKDKNSALRAKCLTTMQLLRITQVDASVSGVDEWDILNIIYDCSLLMFWLLPAYRELWMTS